MCTSLSHSKDLTVGKTYDLLLISRPCKADRLSRPSHMTLCSRPSCMLRENFHVGFTKLEAVLQKPIPQGTLSGLSGLWGYRQAWGWAPANRIKGPRELKPMQTVRPSTRWSWTLPPHETFPSEPLDENTAQPVHWAEGVAKWCTDSQPPQPMG